MAPEATLSPEELVAMAIQELEGVYRHARSTGTLGALDIPGWWKRLPKSLNIANLDDNCSLRALALEAGTASIMARYAYHIGEDMQHLLLEIRELMQLVADMGWVSMSQDAQRRFNAAHAMAGSCRQTLYVYQRTRTQRKQSEP